MLYLYVYKHWDPLFAVKTDTEKNYAKEAICLGKSEHKPGSMSSF